MITVSTKFDKVLVHSVATGTLLSICKAQKLIAQLMKAISEIQDFPTSDV